MPEISVIIPTWNRAEFIEKAVRSVLNQTFSDLEVLVCDDGSTDNTKEIVQSINDIRVKWIEGEHGGRPAIPRNHGIKASTGEWLAFLDSDDEWLPDKLEKQLGQCKKNNCLASCTNAYRLIPSEGIKGNMSRWEKDIVTFDNLLEWNRVICSSALVHKSVFNKVKGFSEDEQLCAVEDYALWLRVATQTDFAFLTEPLLIYREEPLISVRALGAQDDLIQRRFIFADFINWAKEANVSRKFIKKAKKSYNYALIMLGEKVLLTQKIKRFIKRMIKK